MSDETAIALRPVNPTSYKPEWMRFWSKVEQSGDCWLWTGGKTRNGYGGFSYYQGGYISAHIWAYNELIGPVPNGLILDHLCRNRACVNPRHLEPVTVRVNCLRGTGPSAVNARKTHCNRGHLIDGRNNRERYCKQCAKIALQRWRDSKEQCAAN